MKLRKIVKVLLISALLIAVLVSSVGCSEKQGGNGASKTVQNQNEHPKLLKMGEKATVDDYEVIVLSAKVADEYVDSPGEGNRYIVLRCSFKNLDKEKRYSGIGNKIQWVDAEGRRNGYKGFTGVKLMESKDMLEPGESGEYEAVFAVPKDKNEIEFHYVTMRPIELARWQVILN